MRQLIFITFLAISVSCSSNTQGKADIAKTDTLKVAIQDTAYPTNSQFDELRKKKQRGCN